MMVDIGGGTTDVAIFQESTIRHTAVIAVAGQKVTDDIRIGLSVLDDQAENLKRKHGESYADLIQEDEVITVPGIAGRPPKEITRVYLERLFKPEWKKFLKS